MTKNGLSGAIPNGIASAERLDSLRVGSNHLSGSLPSAMASMAQLAWLDAGKNKLSSQLPNSVGSWSWLYEVIFQRKTKGQQLKGKIVSEFSHFFTFTLFRHFPPGLSPSKQRVLAQGEQKRRKDNKTNSTNGCCMLVVARLSSSYYEVILDTNKLAGHIPSVVAPRKLYKIVLHSNQFSGAVPGALASATKLRSASASPSDHANLPPP